MISSLVGARALGPAGRGDLLVVVLWPPVIAMIAGLGLPTAYKYWMGEGTRARLTTVSNAVIYSTIVGGISILVADLIVPHLVGSRSPQVMTLLRIYQINIPAALFSQFDAGMLEALAGFGWAGAARLLFFIASGSRVCDSVVSGNLTVATATYILIIGQTASTLVGLFAVWHQLRPRWQPSWSELKAHCITVCANILAVLLTLPPSVWIN